MPQVVSALCKLSWTYLHLIQHSTASPVRGMRMEYTRISVAGRRTKTNWYSAPHFKGASSQGGEVPTFSIALLSKLLKHSCFFHVVPHLQVQTGTVILARSPNMLCSYSAAGSF